MRAAYHEKEVQFNPIKDNQRPTATRDEYLLLFWWLNGSTEGLRLRLFSIKMTRNWSLTRNHTVEENTASLVLTFANDNTRKSIETTLWFDFTRMLRRFSPNSWNLANLTINVSHNVIYCYAKLKASITTSHCNDILICLLKSAVNRCTWNVINKIGPFKFCTSINDVSTQLLQ